jgi:hypothetical protein
MPEPRLARQLAGWLGSSQDNSHSDRHLGMMEAIRGVLGERGTATV